MELTTAEREDITTFPRVLIRSRMATLTIAGRAPRQLPFRALGTKRKHPAAAVTAAAYRACFIPTAVRQDMKLPMIAGAHAHEGVALLGAEQAGRLGDHARCSERTGACPRERWRRDRESITMTLLIDSPCRREGHARWLHLRTHPRWSPPTAAYG